MPNTVPRLLVAMALCLLVQAASAETIRVYLSTDLSRTFRITPQGEDGGRILGFSHGQLPLPSGAVILGCDLHLVADTTPGPHAGQDLFGYVDGVRVGYGEVDPKSLGRMAMELKPTACRDLADGDLEVSVKTDSPASDRTYYGGLSSATRYRPRVSLRYKTPDPPLPSWSAHESAPDGYATVEFSGREGPEFLTNAYTDGEAIFVAAEIDGKAKLFRVSLDGPVSGVDIPADIPEGSFAAGTDRGRTNFVGTGMAMSCDYDSLLKIQDCLGKGPRKVALGSGNTPAAGADGALYFRNTEEAGAIVGYNAHMEEIWVTEKKYDDIAPIALSADGRQAFVLGRLTTDSRKRIELARIETDTGRAHPGVEITDRRNGAAMLFAELFRPDVRSEAVERRLVHYVAIAANTSDQGRLQIIYISENPPSSGVFMTWRVLVQLEGKIGAAPKLNPGTGHLFAVLDGYLVEIDWRDGGEDPKPRRVLAAPAAGSGKIFFDPAGGAYLVTGGHLCLAKFSVCRPVDVPSTFDPDGMLFRDDRLVAFGREGVYEFSPRAAAREIRPGLMLRGETYAARSVVLGEDARPGAGTGPVVVRAGRTSMLDGFSWPVGSALEVQAIRTTDGP